MTTPCMTPAAGMLFSAIVLSLVSCLGGIAEGGVSTIDRLSSVQLSDATLPRGMNATEVVETVQRSRQVAGLGRAGVALVEPAGQTSAPFSIGGNPIYTASTWPEHSPAIAFDGTNYLVAWVSDRCGYECSDIWCARVSPSGVVLDPLGTAVCTVSGNQTSPAIAFDGKHFLIVWHDDRSGGEQDALYGARIDTAGTVLDPDGFPISTVNGYHDNPDVLFDGTNYFAVWGWASIYGARVDTAGIVLDPSGIMITNHGRYPAVSFDGTFYLVVWEDSRNAAVPDYSTDIYAARLSKEGTLLDVNAIPVCTNSGNQQDPDLAFDGTNYMIAWIDYRTSTGSVYVARLSLAGVVLDPAGKAISADIYPASPTIGFDGTDYMVTWNDRRSDLGNVYAARISTAGSVLLPNPIAICTSVDYQCCSALAFDGANYLIAWMDKRRGADADIYGARVLPSRAVVLDPGGFPISTACNTQSFPAVAFSGQQYFVVWTESRTNEKDIFGARLTLSGSVLDASPIPICTAPKAQDKVAVVYGLGRYLVVWADYRNGLDYDIYGCRVDTSGAVLDPEGIPISTATQQQTSPDVEFDGTKYFVVWEDSRNFGSTHEDILGARLTTGGVLVDPAGIPISARAEPQTEPEIAFDGTNYLVIWAEQRVESQGDICGTRVNTSGVALDASGIFVSALPSHQASPRLAFGGTNYLVAWVDAPSATGKIYAARVTTSGSVLDSTPVDVCSSAYGQYAPSIAFDGSNYVILWTDYRNASRDVFAARIEPSGAVLDPDGLPICTLDYDQGDVAAARGPLGNLLLAYRSFMPAPYNSTHILGNIWSGPTAVEVSSVSLEGRGGKVTISWRAVLEMPGSGFQLLRSDSPFGNFVRLDLSVRKSTGTLFSCIDQTVISDRTYWYEIAVATGDVIYGPAEVYVEPVPVAYQLRQNHPNPFNPSCAIQFEIPAPANVSLIVFDIWGRPVRTLVECLKDPGKHTAVWDGRGDDGTELGSGIYFCRFKADGFVASCKMVLLR